MQGTQDFNQDWFSGMKWLARNVTQCQGRQFVKTFCCRLGEGKHVGKGLLGEEKHFGIGLTNIHLCRNHSGDLQCNYIDLVSIWLQHRLVWYGS